MTASPETRSELVKLADMAGAQSGTAAQMLRDAIRAAYQHGNTKFADSDIGAMREAFRDAYARSGKSKQAGNMLFARAWDELIEEGLALEQRPRKGVNAKPAKPAKVNDDDEAAISEVASNGKLTAEQKVEIAADLVKRAGVTADMIKAAIAAGQALKPYRDGKDKDLAHAVGEAMFALTALGRACNSLLDAAGLKVTKRDVSAPPPRAAAAPVAKPAAAKKKPKTAPAGATA
jgi:hypothetical protein